MCKLADNQGAKKNPQKGGWGCMMGLEPTALGTTIRCSNQLSYTHHVDEICQQNLTNSKVDGIFDGICDKNAERTRLQKYYFLISPNEIFIPEKLISKKTYFCPRNRRTAFLNGTTS